MRRNTVGALMIGLCAATPAHAADSLLFSGAEVGGHRNSYGQLGVMTPLPGSRLGSGWVARGLVDGVTYKYDSGAREIDGDALGVQATLGYQSSGAPGWWAFYTGPAYRHTDLSPNDSTNDASGGDFGWIVQAEGERKISQSFKLNLAGNYMISGNNAFWTRMRVLYQLDGELYAGPEATYQGDDEYRAWSVGVGLFGIQLSDSAFLGIKGGIRKNEDFSAAPYGGMEISYSF